MSEDQVKPGDGSLVGRSVNQYVILEKVGKGNMGEVYLATDTSLERKVALKFLTDEALDDVEARSKILAEARTAAAIDHPYICKVYEVGQHHDQVFIGMEFVEGETLEDRLQRGPLSLSESLKIAAEVADALIKAHDKGIIHRDMKPANLIQTPEGHIKVLDFGLAERTRQQAGADPDSELRILKGTIPYMSPEQVIGEPLDCRSDIFSLGVILYEMLAGVHPFRMQNAMETARAIQLLEPDPLPLRSRACPQRLERLVSRMMAKKPDERCSSARAVLEELELLKERPGISPHGSELRSLAVLPFLNLSTDPENEYFSDGITEEIITRLSGIDGLRVISRTSVMRYKNTTKDLRTVGRELGVDCVLEGSVRRQDNRLRITCKLMDAETEKQIWASTYDRKSEDIFAVQSEVTEHLASTLKTSLTSFDREQLARSQTRNAKAYHLYLRGRYFLHKLSAEATEHAISYFRRSLDEDPMHAAALAGLSRCYANAGHFDYLPKQEAYSRAQEAAEKALHLDRSLAEAHTSHGFVLFHDWKWSAAELALQKAIQINPNYGDSHVLFAWCLMAMGRWEEALEQSRAALRVDPLSVLAGVNLGWVLLCHTQFDEAMHQFERALELDPSNLHARTLMAFCLQGKGLWEEAISILEKWSWSKPMLGWAYELGGRRQDADRILSEVIRPSERARHSQAQIALNYFFRGDIDRGLSWLEKAYIAHDTQLAHVRLNFFAAPFFAHPKARQIYQAMGLEPSIERIYRRIKEYPAVPETLSRIEEASRKYGRKK